jgi:hypothetical protein
MGATAPRGDHPLITHVGAMQLVSLPACRHHHHHQYCTSKLRITPMRYCSTAVLRYCIQATIYTSIPCRLVPCASMEHPCFPASLIGWSHDPNTYHTAYTQTVVAASCCICMPFTACPERHQLPGLGLPWPAVMHRWRVTSHTRHAASHAGTHAIRCQYNFARAC